MTLSERFRGRTGTPGDLGRLVVDVSWIPYGRASRRTAEAVVDEWRGTCSTKHLLLRDLVTELHPDVGIELFHRPYLVTPGLARSLWGDEVAGVVPEGGLVDVHTFARLIRERTSLVVDVTFPLAEWDARSDTPLACGEGPDQPAGADPLATKEDLVAEHCDPAVREPFIETLARVLEARAGRVDAT